MLVLMQLLSNTLFCTDPERQNQPWGMVGSSGWSLTHSSLLWSVCWRRETRGCHKNSLLSPAGTLSVRKRIYLMWVRIIHCPASELIIFFRPQLICNEIFLQSECPTAPAELPTEPDHGLSDIERALWVAQSTCARLCVYARAPAQCSCLCVCADTYWCWCMSCVI